MSGILLLEGTGWPLLLRVCQHEMASNDYIGVPIRVLRNFKSGVTQVGAHILVTLVDDDPRGH